MTESDAWLVPEADRIPSPFLGRTARSVEVVVYHYTASPPGRGPCGSNRQRIERWLQGASSASSTHFVILRDGTLLQGAPLDARTWHAGRSEWSGRRSVNAFSVGVDLENVGRLMAAQDKWWDAYGRPFCGAIAADPHRPSEFAWEPYTLDQVEAVCDLATRLARRFPVLVDPTRHVGHEHVSPGRKLDPGPAFPWAEVHGAVKELGQGLCVV